MTPEQLAIAGMFSLYTGGVATVVKILWNENRRLTAKIDEDTSWS